MVINKCKERERLAFLLENNLSNDTLKLYDIIIEENGYIGIELKPPFNIVDVFVRDKNDDIKLELNIPNSGSWAYTFEDAEQYFNLLRGCAEINEIFKSFKYKDIDN